MTNLITENIDFWGCGILFFVLVYIGFIIGFIYLVVSN